MNLDLLKTLISIPSFSREEGSAADALEAFLRLEGYAPKRCGHNLWVESEPECCGKPCILLNAHIDTVKPSASWSTDPFTPIEREGCIVGLGSNDDGGSLIALWEAYKHLSSRPQPYRLVYSATAQEEVSGPGGVEMILPLVGKVDLGIIGEPTGMRMAVAEKSLMVLDCTAHGKAGHAAREEGVNAIYEALEDIEWFRAAASHFERISPYTGRVKMSVTQISAGTQHNVVPDECRFVVDVRGNGLYSNVELLSEVEKNVSCEVKARSTRLEGSFIDRDHPVVQRGLGLGLESFGSPTTSNQSLCPFTTLKIGPGESSRSHTAGEFIKISEIQEAAVIYERLLDQLKID